LLRVVISTFVLGIWIDQNRKHFLITYKPRLLV
jgi:hypothetical protein